MNVFVLCVAVATKIRAFIWVVLLCEHLMIRIKAYHNQYNVLVS